MQCLHRASTCLTDISAAGRCLAREVSRDIASCAVLIVFPPGVFITMMPKSHQQNCNGEWVIWSLFVCSNVPSISGHTLYAKNITLLCGSSNVDIINSHTGSSDNAHLYGMLQYFSVHFRGGADYKTIVLSNYLYMQITKKLINFLLHISYFVVYYLDQFWLR